MRTLKALIAALSGWGNFFSGPVEVSEKAWRSSFLNCVSCSFWCALTSVVSCLALQGALSLYRGLAHGSPPVEAFLLFISLLVPVVWELEKPSNKLVKVMKLESNSLTKARGGSPRSASVHQGGLFLPHRCRLAYCLISGCVVRR